MSAFAVLRRPAVLVTTIIVLVLASCGSSVTRDDLVGSFRTSEPTASLDEAECVVDALIDEYSLAGLERELEAVPRASAFERSQFEAEAGCGLTDDIQTELERQLAASGIDDEGARCAAAALTEQLDDDDLDVLLTGEINDAFYAKYFVALEACDALP